MAEMTNFVHPAQQEYKPFKPGYFINSIIGLALIFGFGFLPAIEPLTPLGMKLLGIFRHGLSFYGLRCHMAVHRRNHRTRPERVLHHQ